MQITLVAGRSPSDAPGVQIDLRTYQYIPVRESVADTRHVSSTTNYDPLADNTESYLDMSGFYASGTFVFDRTGTSTPNGDGSYTADYDQTLRVEESTVTNIRRYSAPDIAKMDLSFEGGVDLASIIGKMVGRLITDGSVIIGTSRSDVLATVGAAEIILAGGGDDKVDARGGADVIDGGWGNDKLTGGFGADTFIFETHYEHDTIKDFKAQGDHHDKIDISKLHVIEGFRDLKLSHLEDHGRDVWIEAGKDVLIIKGHEISDLVKADFLF